MISPMISRRQVTTSLVLGPFAAPLVAPGKAWAQAAAKPAVKLSIGTTVLSYLSYWTAMDGKYFDQFGIDFTAQIVNSPGAVSMPRLARGDIDLLPAAPNPALFNLPAQGFDVKVISSIEQPHPGWNPTAWLVVRKDLWDSGEIRKIEDLKGHVLDGGPTGGGGNVLIRAALDKAGIMLSDVKLQTKMQGAADEVEGLRDKAMDVAGVIEPYASILVSEGIGVRLASLTDIAPWTQQTVMLASEQAISKNRDGLVGFLKGWLTAVKEIADAGSAWNDKELAIASKYLQIPVDTLKKVPGPPYEGQFGDISLDALSRNQDFFAGLGMVEKKADINALVDSSLIAQARKELGI